CESRKRVVRRRTLRSVGCASCKLGQTVSVDVVRAGDARTGSADDTQGHDDVLDECRLVHFRCGEAGEPGAFGVGESFGLAVCRFECGACNLDRTHDLTPTWTLRNRAGAAPCETCAVWPGWPLPQLVSPNSRHESWPAIASREPQKPGVIPA